MSGYNYLSILSIQCCGGEINACNSFCDAVLLESRGRWRAWGIGGGRAAAALASAGVCDMVAFLVGTQQT